MHVFTIGFLMAMVLAACFHVLLLLLLLGCVCVCVCVHFYAGARLCVATTEPTGDEQTIILQHIYKLFRI